MFRFGDFDLIVGSIDEDIPGSSENSNGFDFLAFVFKPRFRGWPDGGTLKSSSLSLRLLLGLLSIVSRAFSNGEENISISSEIVNGGGGGRGALVFVVVFAENGGELETNAAAVAGARDVGADFPAGAGGVEEIKSIMSGILFFYKVVVEVGSTL